MYGLGADSRKDVALDQAVRAGGDDHANHGAFPNLVKNDRVSIYDGFPSDA